MESSRDDKSIRQWRKKPVVISAIEWTGDNLRDVIAFTGRHPSADAWTWEYFEEVVRTKGLKIFTLEGHHMASVGDYIIKGVHGEVYPCKPDIFAKTYEPATTPLPPRGPQGSTPRMDATLGKGNDWVFAEGCRLERELAEANERADVWAARAAGNELAAPSAPQGETPRTDANAVFGVQLATDWTNQEAVHADFARQLEREARHWELRCKAAERTITRLGCTSLPDAPGEVAAPSAREPTLEMMSAGNAAMLDQYETFKRTKMLSSAHVYRAMIAAQRTEIGPT